MLEYGELLGRVASAELAYAEQQPQVHKGHIYRMLSIRQLSVCIRQLRAGVC